MRPVSSVTRSSEKPGSARSISKCVRAARGTSVSVDMRVRDAAVAPDRRVDRAAARRRAALHEREVLAPQLASAQQLLQRAVDRLGLGDDEQPRGVLVEPVDDPGARRILSAARRGGPRAPRTASRRGARAPGARRRRPACRSRAGARPRRRRRTAPPRRGVPGRRPASGSGATSIRSPAATRWRFGRTAPSTVTRPASIARCACAREPERPASTSRAARRPRPARPRSQQLGHCRARARARGRRRRR